MESSTSRSIVMSKPISKKSKKISKEDREIMNSLEKIKSDLSLAYCNLDNTTDTVLIDSYIYEAMSLNMKYQYYLRLCKQKGLIADGFFN